MDDYLWVMILFYFFFLMGRCGMVDENKTIWSLLRTATKLLQMVLDMERRVWTSSRDMIEVCTVERET